MKKEVPIIYQMLLNKIKANSLRRDKITVSSARYITTYFRIPIDKIRPILHEMHEMGLIVLNHQYIDLPENIIDKEEQF